MKTHFILCDCGIPEHQLIVQYDPVDEPPHRFLYVAVHLVNFAGFWQRLRASLRYLFGRQAGTWEMVGWIIGSVLFIGPMDTGDKRD